MWSKGGGRCGIREEEGVGEGRRKVWDVHSKGRG